MHPIDGDPRIVVALDFADPAEAMALVARLDPALCRVKVGKELFTRAGPALVADVQRRGFEVFLDLKFHDIPCTVAAACRAAADLGVWMVNVHASGGVRMLAAAREALGAANPDRPWLVAVTVLTSLERSDLAALGLDEEPLVLATRLADLAARGGCDGVVCSAHEAAALRATHGPTFVLVTPGIRPATAAGDDQRRIMGPSEALAAGSDYLVIGRPITAAPDPAAALRTVSAEINTRSEGHGT